MDHYIVDVHITNKRPMAQLAIRVFTLILSYIYPLYSLNMIINEEYSFPQFLFTTY